MNAKNKVRGKKPADAPSDPPPAPPKKARGRPRTTGSGIGPIIGFRVSAAEYTELVAEATAKGLPSPSAAAAARVFPNRARAAKLVDAMGRADKRYAGVFRRLAK